jgi:hypothetical protein
MTAECLPWRQVVLDAIQAALHWSEPCRFLQIRTELHMLHLNQ